MKDLNQNNIPDAADPIIGAIVMVASVVLIGLSQFITPCPAWVPITMGCLTLLAGYFKFGVAALPGAAARVEATQTKETQKTKSAEMSKAVEAAKASNAAAEELGNKL